MMTTLSESQADLPRLVELASRGEDVVITVDGKPKAKLTRPETPQHGNGSESNKRDLGAWLAELQSLREKFDPGRIKSTVEDLIAEDRADRA